MLKKCKVHFGFNNTMKKYKMDGKEIVEVWEENDLKITFQNDLKCSKHCEKVLTSGNKKISVISSTFE